MLAEYMTLDGGKRLEGISPENFRNIGYWSFNKATRELSFCQREDMTIDCGIPQETLDKAEDWVIQQPDDFDTVLHSLKLGKAEKCAKTFELEGRPVPEPRNVLPGHIAAVPESMRKIDVPSKVLEERPSRIKGSKKAADTPLDTTPVKAPRRPTKGRPGA